MPSGWEWADNVYREKLANPATLPNLGAGFSNELRAARAVQKIAEKKLWVPGAAPGQKYPAAGLSKAQRAWWMEAPSGPASSRSRHLRCR